jgi:hypothetical protein
MKNSFKSLLIIASIILTSCSNSDDNSTSSNSPANTIKKLSETTYFEGQTNSFTANFTYENGNLKSISNQTQKIDISYSDGRISETKIYNNNILQTSYAFEYQNNNLYTITNSVNNFERTLFTYTNSTQKTEENQSLNNSVWQTQVKDEFIFVNDNIQQRTNTFTNIPNSTYKVGYEYDTKLNPMNYMAKEVREIIGLESCNFKNKNNTTFSYNYNDINSTTPILNHTYQITYNSQNLPTQIKKYSSNNTLIAVSTFEYN